MSLNGSQKGLGFSKQLSVRSSDASSGTTTDFKFNAGDTLQQVLRVSINTVSFYNNIYNIYNDNRGFNNTYNYAYQGTQYSYTVMPGYYNINLLLNTLNADLTTNTGGTVSWSFNAITNLVTLNLPPPGQIFQLNSVTNSPLGLVTLLGGYPFTQTITYSAGGTITGTTIPLLGPTSVYLRSSTLSPANSIEVNGAFANTLIVLPVNVGFTQLFKFDCLQDSLCEIAYNRARNLNQIDIQLTDANGKILDNHGGSVNIQLRVWYNQS